MIRQLEDGSWEDGCEYTEEQFDETWDRAQKLIRESIASAEAEAKEAEETMLRCRESVKNIRQNVLSGHWAALGMFSAKDLELMYEISPTDLNSILYDDE